MGEKVLQREISQSVSGGGMGCAHMHTHGWMMGLGEWGPSRATNVMVGLRSDSRNRDTAGTESEITRQHESNLRIMIEQDVHLRHVQNGQTKDLGKHGSITSVQPYRISN